MTPFANRLSILPRYIFSEINRIKAEAQKNGVDLLSLSIGDPDLPTPSDLVDKMRQSIQMSENHAYSPYEGTLSFRKSVAQWFRKRFGVYVDPETEVIALIGSKEGIAHFPLAFCNPGDCALYPSPGYPIFETSILLSGASAIPIPHRIDQQFLPDLDELKKLLERHRPKFMLLNFPSNPTTAVANVDFLKAVVDLSRASETILVYDNAYSEIYPHNRPRPLSVLQIEGAKQRTIEFHSFSKTFNMTGWRLGFAVGNAQLVQGLLKVKTNIDSGPLLAVQQVGTFALERSEEYGTAIRAIYDERREILLRGLSKLGIEFFDPKATFYVWARTPNGMPSMDFAKSLIEKVGLIVTPGIGFGREGESFFRLSLTAEKEKIEDALVRLARFFR